MPLLVEKDMAGEYHLVVVVGASEEVRLRRLVEQRAMTAEDARARIAAQADDAARRAAADVWVDNEGPLDAMRIAVRRLWHERIELFEDHLRHGVRSRLLTPVLSPPDPRWPAEAARLLARIRHAAGGSRRPSTTSARRRCPGSSPRTWSTSRSGPVPRRRRHRGIRRRDARDGVPPVGDNRRDEGHDGSASTTARVARKVIGNCAKPSS